MKPVSRALAMLLASMVGSATLLAQTPPDLPPPADPAAGPPTPEQLVQACNAKDKSACVRLVAMYETGDGGVTRDLPKAIAWAKLACRAGEIERGCAFVGLQLVTSQAANSGRDAAPFLERACNEEHALTAATCERLAQLYLGRQEPGYDPISAKTALQRACAKGSANACTRERSVPLDPGATEWRDLGTPLGADALITEWIALSDKQSLVLVGPNFSRQKPTETLWRTTDGGQTWARVHEAPLLGGGSFGRRLASDGKIVIYRTREAWLRSTDGGATWSPIASLAAAKTADAFWTVARVGREFFLADQKQLLVSTDGGKSFVHRLDAPDKIGSVIGTTDALFLKLLGSDGKGYRVEGTRLVPAETFPFADGKVAARSYFSGGLETSTDGARSWQSWRAGFVVISGFAANGRAMFVGTGEAVLWSSYGGAPRQLSRPVGTSFCKELQVMGSQLFIGCFSGYGKAQALHLYAIDYERVGGKVLAGAALPPAYTPPPSAVPGAPVATPAPTPAPMPRAAATPGGLLYSKSWRAGDPAFAPWKNDGSAMFYNRAGWLQFESYFDDPRWVFLVDQGPSLIGQNFVVEADVKQLGGGRKPEFFGVMWGVAATSFSYQQVFWLDSQGRYAFSYNAGGAQVTPILWRAHPSLPRGPATYHVEVKRVGTMYSFWVNGRLIDQIRTTGLGGPRVGFLVGGRGILEVHGVRVSALGRLAGVAGGSVGAVPPIPQEDPATQRRQREEEARARRDRERVETRRLASEEAAQKSELCEQKGEGPVCLAAANLQLGGDLPDAAEVRHGRAAALLDKGCQAGHCESCARLESLPFVTNEQVAKVRQLGQPICEAECRARTAPGPVSNDGQDACLVAGSWLVRATSSIKELTRAVALLEKSCATNGYGCEALGRLFTIVEFAPKEEPRLAAFLKQRCEALREWGEKEFAQEPDFCHNGALRGGRRSLMQGCKLGKLPACAQLGRELRTDLPELAMVHFTKACDGGIVAACFDLGQLLERGEGTIKRDEARAKPLYARVEASCDKGDAESCRQLAGRERGVKPENNRWWMKALVFATQRCATGDGKACQRAALAHRLGEGTPKDEAQAAELLQKSCAAGVKEACRK